MTLVTKGTPEGLEKWIMLEVEAPQLTEEGLNSSLSMVTIALDRAEPRMSILALQGDNGEHAFGSCVGTTAASVEMFFPNTHDFPRMVEGRFSVDVRSLFPVLYESYRFEDDQVVLVRSVVVDYGEVEKTVQVLQRERGYLRLRKQYNVLFVPDCPFCRARNVQCACSAPMRRRSIPSSSELLRKLRSTEWRGSSWSYFSKYIAPSSCGRGMCNIETEELVVGERASRASRAVFSVPYKYFFTRPSRGLRVTSVQLKTSALLPPNLTLTGRTESLHPARTGARQNSSEDLANSVRTKLSTTNNGGPDNETRIKCEQCNVHYVSNSALRRHQRTVHKKLWKFECACGKRFYHQNDFHRHVRGKRHTQLVNMDKRDDVL
mmetsp:Transcript_12270/g.37435  ORF Transcript_12270/g.37435 Transcript_12270/m.37435 type:complete len:377 (+) Transcript_12270:280-1410(+)